VGADAIVFCSDSHTAPGHISVGNSAQRLLEGGRTAVAIAPAGLARAGEGARLEHIVAVGDAEGGAQVTAESLTAALGGSVDPVANDETDLIVFDSRADAEPRQVLLSSSAAHLMEVARSSVLVLPRGVALQFAATPAQLTA
jgi:hypothetical protein